LKKICKDKKGRLQLEKHFPKVYFADKNEIIMDDLTHQGFIMVDKKKWQDFDYASIVMEALAKFHATSYAYIQNCGGENQFMEKFPLMNDMFAAPEVRDIFKPMFQSPMETLLQMLKTDTSGIEGALETYEKLKKFEGKWFDVLIESMTSDRIFNVVNHGDCWNNNMMFHHDGDKKRVVFLDFQGGRISSPCNDLSYYLFTSTQPSTRKQWKTLLKIYYDEFMQTMKVLNQPIELQFDELLEDFSNRVITGLFFGFFMTVGLEAMSTIDIEGSDKGFDTDGMAKTINEWIQNNPDKNKSMISRVIDMVGTCESINPDVLL